MYMLQILTKETISDEYHTYIQIQRVTKIIRAVSENKIEISNVYKEH
jgi:hypothetical protein